MTEDIAELLSQLAAPGAFATRLAGSADEFVIDIKGLGELPLPITARTAQRLQALARPSPFGLRDQTLYDPSVRSTSEISARSIKVSPTWKAALARHLKKVQADLGLPAECEIKPTLDKLLIYEEGQFFKTHQDSEKSDAMFGTLVVVLPSEYKGGALTVEHQGEKKTFARLKSQSEQLSLLAFYADCHHAIGPVTSGVRVALTYQLAIDDRIKSAEPTVPQKLVAALTDRVRDYFTEPQPRRYGRDTPTPPDRLVYLLDHEYSQHSLSLAHLKNGDRLRVAALQAVAKQLACETYLALANVHETWTCEDDYDSSRYGRRGYYRRYQYDDAYNDDEVSSAAEHEVVDLVNRTIELHHWRDPRGAAADGSRSHVDEEELCFTKPTSELEPFKSEHEGYQGNYGNTLDRWYHRAAFAMWPRSLSFALHAESSPEWALDQLLALPARGAPELGAKVQTLVPRWSRAAGTIEGARFLAKLLKVAKRIEDPELARVFILPLRTRLGARALQRDFAMLVDKHGSAWAQDLVEEWTKNDHGYTPEWASALPGLCVELIATSPKAGKAFAPWLVEREAQRALRRYDRSRRDQQQWLDLDGLADEASHLAHVLAAATAAGELGIADDAIAKVLDTQPTVPTSYLVHLLRQSYALSPETKKHLARSRLQRLCVERLEAAACAAPRAPNDWVIEPSLKCECGDCQQLRSFLGSTRSAFDWPLAKDRRQHIHQVIEAAHLPVGHTTLRKGSPHVLQLRKDDSLFTRERDHRARAKKILRELQDANRAPAAPR